MAGLFRNDPSSPEGKYPVLLRRDGTRPEWEYFVLGARDPASVLALRAYADECQRRGLDPVYVSDVRSMAASWKVEQAGEAIMRIEPDGRPLPKPADPDGPRHRKDDPDVLTFPGTLAAYKRRVQGEAMAEVVRFLTDRIVSEAAALPRDIGAVVAETVATVLEKIAAEFPASVPAAPRVGSSA